MSDPSNPLILLTEATGYMGGRLLLAREKKSHRLRCPVRSPECLRVKVASTTEIVSGDLLQPETLTPTSSGVHTAYCLVHSTGSTGAFEEQDRRVLDLRDQDSVSGEKDLVQGAPWPDHAPFRPGGAQVICEHVTDFIFQNWFVNNSGYN